MKIDDFVDYYGPAALVTGASSGIGQSFAEQLAARGLDLLLVARRVDRLDALAQRLSAEHGVRVRVCEADLAQPEHVQRIVETAHELDIGLVVSNAGFGLKGAFEAGDPRTLSEMVAVNCEAPMQLARALVPRLRQRGRGGIVLTSSVEGLIGCPYSAVYSATKGFLVNFGEALWAELEPSGIHVLVLCPGATDTEAPRLQGIDPSTLRNLMSPDEVAGKALANLRNGPVYVPSEHYRASFDHLRSMPRADALRLMAQGMRR